MTHQAVIMGYGDAAIVVKPVTNFGDIGDGNMALIWDQNVPVSNFLDIYNKLRQSLDVVREDGFRFPFSFSDYISFSIPQTAPKSKAVVAISTSIDVVAIDQVHVAYSGTFAFTRVGATSLMLTTGRLLLNRMLETMKKG